MTSVTIPFWLTDALVLVITSSVGFAVIKLVGVLAHLARSLDALDTCVTKITARVEYLEAENKRQHEYNQRQYEHNLEILRKIPFP